MRLDITHYYIELPSPNKLKPLVCICKVYDGDQEAYFVEGLDLTRRLVLQKVESLEELGHVAVVDTLCEKTESNGLFLDPYGNVFLAAKDDPLDNRKREIVAKLPQDILDTVGAPELADVLDAHLIGKTITEIISILMKPLKSNDSVNQEYLRQVEAILLREYSDLMQEHAIERRSRSFEDFNELETSWINLINVPGAN